MIKVHRAIIRHKGLLVDNTTKIEVLMPELQTDDDSELIKLTKQKEAAVIIMDPNHFDAMLEVIEQASAIVEDKNSTWERDEETGFESTVES